MGLLVVDDSLSDRRLEVLRFHELLLRVHLGLVDQVRVGEQPLHQSLHELADLRRGERLSAEEVVHLVDDDLQCNILGLLSGAGARDLNLLPAERLRRFLEAFRVEIHYDLYTGRATFKATFKAEISAETVNQLAQQASRADATLWQAAAATHEVRDATNEEGPAKPGGSQMIMGSSFSKCPRRVPSNMGTHWR